LKKICLNREVADNCKGQQLYALKMYKICMQLCPKNYQNMPFKYALKNIILSNILFLIKLFIFYVLFSIL